MNHVAQIVCQKNQVALRDLFKKTRKAKIVQARQMYVYIMFEVYKRKNWEIVNSTGFDHATIRHCIKTVNNRTETEPKYADELNKIIYLCKKGTSNRYLKKVSRRISQLKSKQTRKPLILAA